MMNEDREQLHGGNVSAEVWRVGDTVRRPTGPWTPGVHALLRHLEAVGFEGAPRVFGVDEEGQEILEFIPGVVPWPSSHHTYLGDDDAMWRVGSLLRGLHDAVATFTPPPGVSWRETESVRDSEPFVDERGLIVCHNDPAAWNLVVGDHRWALIDWDFAGPRPFIWDVAYAVIGMVPLRPSLKPLGWDMEAPFPYVARVRALLEGYELEDRDRRRLMSVVVARVASVYDHLRRNASAGVEPWVSQWREGHGRAWAKAMDHGREHHAEWQRAIMT